MTEQPGVDPQGYSDAVKQALHRPLLVLDGGLHVKTASPSFFEAFKSTPEQTLGRSLYELGQGQWDIPALRALLDGLLPDSGAFDDYEVERDFPGIGRRTMLLNGQRLLTGAENTKLILLAMEDITERRHAEMEAARLRQWLGTILASIPDAVIATDCKACVTYLNPAAEVLTGWTLQNAALKPLNEVFNVVDEKTRAPLDSLVDSVIRERATVGPACHALLITGDGSECPIDDIAAPIRDSEGSVTGVVMVSRDITERRRAERLMEASEIRYRRLFEAAHDGILVLDTSTRRIVDVNPFLLRLLQYPRGHFIGKELWEIGIFRDKAANQKAMQELHERGSIRFEHLPLQDRDGRRHPVEIVANIYQEDQSAVIQCNIRDIGERAQFERDREALLAGEQASRLEAEAANRSKDLFLATLSHEVRTPLNAILGWATILRKGNCSAADVREGMEVIERNCKAQASLIEDVLDLSRIISGKLRLRIQLCKLAEIIEAAIDVVRPAADAKGVRLHATLDPADSPFSCDPNRMQQVVWNLLSNAVKFTPRGGKVSVGLTRDRTAARIVVSDEGQGISREFLPYVFDRFRQADSGPRRKLGGLGLGLSIVKHIVEGHGGSVHADSAGEGRGATFTVNLPVRAVQFDEFAGGPADESFDAATPAPVPVRLDYLQVLVVDDEADARRLLVKVLGEAGAAVRAAASVAEAMEALLLAIPDVLVSDMAMPGQDGFDLIRKVRAAGLTAKELPAIALTAFAHPEDRRRMLLAGFQVHLSKPVDPHDLAVIIAGLAGRTG
jgi:PAS domain S-box-containing protein